MPSKKKTPLSSSAPSSSAASPADRSKLAQLKHSEPTQIEKTDMEKLTKMLEEIRGDIADFKKELKDVKEDVTKNDQKIGQLETGAAGMEREVKDLQKARTESDSLLARMELERMSFYLRFQNLIEEEGEDLKDIASTILSEFLQREKDQIWWDIDQIYRVNSTYARTHNVPREVHIKFLRRYTRDEVLRAQRGGALKYKDKEIIILKQIPRKIRERRKRLSFLSKKLYDKGVQFRWLIPEGLLIHWKEGKIKINTLTEAEAFYKDNKTFLDGEEMGATGGGDDQTGEVEGATASLSEEGEAMLLKLRSHRK